MPSSEYLNKQKEILESLINQVNNVNLGKNIKVKNKEILDFYFKYKNSYEGNIITHIINDLNELNYIEINLKNKKILLNPNKINEICEKYLITNPFYKVNFIKENIYKFKKLNNPIIDNELSIIEKNISLNHSLNKYNKEYFLRLNIINEIENNLEEVSKRVFSVKHFNDSKILENNASQIFDIVKKYDDTLTSFNDYLLKHNINLNSLLLRIKGSINFSFNESSINLINNNEEIAISSEIISNSKIQNIKFNKVITIENLTTFQAFNLPNSLIIYTEGFCKNNLVKFLKTMQNSTKNLKFYHFSDLDAGGFYIFNDLKNKTNIDFKPLLMDETIFNKFIDNAKLLTKIDINKLNQLLKNDEFGLFHNLIKRMLETNLKLEQEGIDLSAINIENFL